MADPTDEPTDVNTLLNALVARYRQRGLDLAEQGRRPWQEQARDAPIVGQPLKAKDAYDEGRPWAAAGHGALSALELLPFVPPVARGVSSAVNALRPGIMGTGTKLGTSQYLGSSGVASTMPQDMDAALRAYTEGMRAFPGTVAAFNEAVQARPEQLANAIRLHKELRTPTSGRGSARNRQLDRMVQDEIPMPVRPTAPERPPFMHAFPQSAGDMEAAINQSPALPAAATLGGMAALATGAPQELAREGAHNVADRVEHWANQPPTPSWAKDYSKSPYRLEEFPEARAYNSRMRGQRMVRNTLAGASGLMGAGTVATLPLLKEMSSPFIASMGSMLDDPALMIMGLGPAAVPLGLGIGSGMSAHGAYQAHKRAKAMERMLEANYGRSAPPMQQGPLTDY